MVTMTANEVRLKAKSVIDSIEKMGEHERNSMPSAHFNEDYNRLLTAAKAAAPNVSDGAWPPEVETVFPLGGQRIPVRYAELASYVRQILGFVQE